MLVIETLINTSGKSQAKAIFSGSDLQLREAGQGSSTWLVSGRAASLVYIPYTDLRKIYLDAISSEQPCYLNLVDYARWATKGLDEEGNRMPVPKLEFLIDNKRPKFAAVSPQRPGR